jgi:hypothetical protein
MFAAMPLDLGLLTDSPVHNLPVPERTTVQILEERANELGVEIRRGHEFTGPAQDVDGVTLTVHGPDGAYELRTRYVVGADSAHSPVRGAAGIGFPGVTYDRGVVDVLDTYETERRPVAERTITFSQAQAALLSPGDDVTGLRALFGELLTQPDVVQVIAGLVAGADVRYPVGGGAHALAGRPAPDLDLHTPDGTVRLAELAREARPLLIDLTANGDLHADGVEVVRATADTDATALLLRPDSYVAWASRRTHLDERLRARAAHRRLEPARPRRGSDLAARRLKRASPPGDEQPEPSSASGISAAVGSALPAARSPVPRPLPHSRSRS